MQTMDLKGAAVQEISMVDDDFHAFILHYVALLNYNKKSQKLNGPSSSWHHDPVFVDYLLPVDLYDVVAGWQQAESSSRLHGTWYPGTYPGPQVMHCSSTRVPGTNEKVLRIPIFINCLLCGLRLLNRHHLTIIALRSMHDHFYIFIYGNTRRPEYTGMYSSYSSFLASPACRLMSMNLIQLSFFCMITLAHLWNASKSATTTALVMNRSRKCQKLII